MLERNRHAMRMTMTNAMAGCRMTKLTALPRLRSRWANRHSSIRTRHCTESLIMPSLIDHPTPRPRDEVDAADHEGHEDGRLVEAAPCPGTPDAEPAVRRRHETGVQQRRVSRRIRRGIRCWPNVRRRRQDAAGHRHGRSRSLRQLQRQRRQGGGAFRARSQSSRARRSHWRSSAARAATCFGGAASTCGTRKQEGFKTSSGRARRRSRKTCIDEFTERRRRTRLPGLQRIQVGDRAARRRRTAAANPSRASRHDCPACHARLSVRAGPEQLLNAFCCRSTSPCRSCARAARVGGRRARRAHDRDGRGDAQRRRRWWIS